LSWVLASLFVCACGSSTEGEDTNAEEGSTGQTETGDTGDCLPAVGVYGPCGGSCDQCLIEPDVWFVCTMICVEDSDCGDPADFSGAIPTCVEPYPEAPQMECTLACTSNDDCPCGLACQPSSGICGVNL
jgi:hypothetical protein